MAQQRDEGGFAAVLSTYDEDAGEQKWLAGQMLRWTWATHLKETGSFRRRILRGLLTLPLTTELA